MIDDLMDKDLFFSIVEKFIQFLCRGVVSVNLYLIFLIVYLFFAVILVMIF